MSGLRKYKDCYIDSLNLKKLEKFLKEVFNHKPTKKKPLIFIYGDVEIKNDGEFLYYKAINEEWVEATEELKEFLNN